MAQLDIAEGKYDSAKTILNQLLAASSQNLTARFLLGVAEEGAGIDPRQLSIIAMW